MRTISNTFAGAGSWRLAIPGRYFRILNSSSPVDVTFFKNGSPGLKAEAVESGYYAIPREWFDGVEITSASAQTIKIGISDGDGGYDSSVITTSALLAATINDAAPVVVGVAATLLLAADTARMGARFYNAGAADVYLGGSGVTVANGAIKITPGSLWIEDNAAPGAWYGISGTAAQSVRVQEVKR
ncbi:MAG: hypothetical protein K8H84_07840 [Sulfuricella denitrificans]|nr:hypothetical protein [Sulfuricella denitrificans]